MPTSLVAHITTRLTNSLQSSFSRMRQLSSPYFANRQNVAAELKIAGTSQNPMKLGPPSLSFTNYAGLNDGNASLTAPDQFGGRQPHMGSRPAQLHLRRRLPPAAVQPVADSNGRGTYTFTGSATSLLVNGVLKRHGYDLATFCWVCRPPAPYGTATPTVSARVGLRLLCERRLAHRSAFSLTWAFDGLRRARDRLYNRLVNLDIAGYSAATAVEAGRRTAR